MDGTSRKPQNVIGYVRLSELRSADLDEDGNGKGNVDQRQRITDRAKLRGWRIVHWIVENDLSPGQGKNRNASAFKRRKIALPDGRVEMRTVRPGFRTALDMLVAGKADGFMALDLDRTVRDPRDLEDMIDVVEQHRVAVDSVTGSLRLDSDADITMARVMVAVANKESRDKARRVAAARRRQAVAGEYGGGRRPFGFCSGPPPVRDGQDPVEAVCAWHGGRDCRSGVTPIEAETTVIEDCSKRLLQGVNLRALAAELRAGTVATVTGAPWRAETLREVLLRPRNAGLATYRGEVLEQVQTPWDEIVSRDVWQAVCELLTDPSRRTVPPGAAPKWTGSGLYRCGICTPPASTGTGGPGKPVTCKVTLARRAARYTCTQHSHLARNVAGADAVVFAHVLYAVTHPRAFELLGPTAPDIDADGLRAERAQIRQRLDQLAADEMLGTRTRSQVDVATEAGRARIAQIDDLLRTQVSDDPLSDLVNSPDPVQAWADMALANRRVIIGRLCTVTIMPSGRRGRGFDATTVRVDPKHQLGAPTAPTAPTAPAADAPGAA